MPSSSAFADDYVIGFRDERDAHRVIEVIPKRFGRHDLTVHPTKTKLDRFRPPSSKMKGGRGSDDRPGTFDFLGFTHYWAVSLKGALEYGSDELQVHVDGVRPGQRVLIVDDLLATGGTVEACCRLLEKCDAEIVGCSFLIHLVQLGGAERLNPYRVESVLKYDQDDHEAELSL